MVSQKLQALLDAPDLNSAIERVIPFDCGVHPDWILKMRRLVFQSAARMKKVDKKASGERLAAVLFKIPNRAFLAVLGQTELADELATWDKLMLTTLRDCTLAVLECRWDSEESPSPVAANQAGRIAA